MTPPSPPPPLQRCSLPQTCTEPSSAHWEKNSQALLRAVSKSVPRVLHPHNSCSPVQLPRFLSTKTHLCFFFSALLKPKTQTEKEAQNTQRACSYPSPTVTALHKKSLIVTLLQTISENCAATSLGQVLFGHGHGQWHWQRVNPRSHFNDTSIGVGQHLPHPQHFMDHTPSCFWCFLMDDFL